MWILAAAYSRAVIGAAEPTASVPAPPLDKLMVFGFMSAVFTLVCLAHVHHYRSARLLLAGALLAQAAFAFLYGGWPIGLVALVSSGMAAHWWWRYKPRADGDHTHRHRNRKNAAFANAMGESRLSRMFRPASDAGRSVNDN